MSYQLGKATTLARARATSHAARILNQIHSHLSGKRSTRATGGYSYFMNFIDDYSWFRTIVLLINQSNAFTAIDNYIKAVENQTGHTVQHIKTDNGRENVNSYFLKLVSQTVIEHETSVPDSHESNGIAEHYNLTIQDLVCTVGINSRLPTTLWGEAVSMLTHVKNRVPLSNLPN